MLTVDYDRLGVRAAERLLDLGCGAGRHAFEAARRGADVVALDVDAAELKDVAATFGAMQAAGELRGDGVELQGDGVDGVDGVMGSPVNGSAPSLPFPDGAFDRVIAAEVLEHIPDDTSALGELARVLRPGGSIAITVPRWYPELVNWALSDAYHLTPGGHVRIYRRSALAARMRGAGLRVTGHHHAHSLHSPYWWIKCAVGVDNDDHPLVAGYHRFLVWDITRRPLATRVADAVLNPVLGKSIVIYGEKPC